MADRDGDVYTPGFIVLVTYRLSGDYLVTNGRCAADKNNNDFFAPKLHFIEVISVSYA
jgi:hypothetical protein